MTPLSYATARKSVPDAGVPKSSFEKRLRAFLDGETHGEELLHALYDHILDEPIPERLTAVLRR